MKTTLFTCFIVVANLSLQIFAVPISSLEFPYPPEEVFRSLRKEDSSAFNRNQADATLGRNNFMNRFGFNRNVHELPNPDDSHLSPIAESLVGFCGNGKMDTLHLLNQIENGNSFNFNDISELTENEIVIFVKAIVEMLRIFQRQTLQKFSYIRDSMEFRLRPDLGSNDIDRLHGAISLAFQKFHYMIQRWSQPGEIENFVRLYKNEIPSGIQSIKTMLNIWNVKRLLEHLFDDMGNLQPNYQ
ncbi:uncharacterized protein LOC130672884 [Microplitis mediator]|uniref:uncharacterized protein LOC130672884 n=1 Tax=Microplitis mediator TaxID=375433 RepID=UPI002556462A|nr:uncharacterized protein LOC130672884 [Microplitis mediator]